MVDESQEAPRYTVIKGVKVSVGEQVKVWWKHSSDPKEREATGKVIDVGGPPFSVIEIETAEGDSHVLFEDLLTRPPKVLKN